MVTRLIVLSLATVTLLGGCKYRANYHDDQSAPLSVADTNYASSLKDRSRQESVIRQALIEEARDPDETVEISGEVEAEDVAVTEVERGRLFSHHAVIRSSQTPLPPYILDTGDRIRVFVYAQPNLSRVYTLDDRGRISIPLIGQVTARGRTTHELEHIVESRLGVKHVKDPEVSIEAAVLRPIFVLGEVRGAGRFEFVHGMTGQAAIAVAGGYGPRADQQKIQITRFIDGARRTFYLSPHSFIHPGDTIVVKERWF